MKREQEIAKQVSDSLMKASPVASDTQDSSRSTSDVLGACVNGQPAASRTGSKPNFQYYGSNGWVDAIRPKPVPSPRGFEEFTFFLHKHPGGWSVTETTSGLMAHNRPGRTQKEAITFFEMNLLGLTPGDLENQIANGILATRGKP